MYKSKICFADHRVIPWFMAVFFFLGLIIPCNALSTTSAIPQVLSRKVIKPDTAYPAMRQQEYTPTTVISAIQVRALLMRISLILK